MNGIDYTKKLNRQNENYQKNLRDQARNHKEQVENIQENSDNRVKSQSKNYMSDREKLEKSYSSRLGDLRSNQSEELQNKDKLYQKEVERNKAEFHGIKKKNLDEWRTKFTDLKNDFDENSKQKDITNKTSKEELTKNYKQNLENIQKKSREDLDRYVETNGSSSDNTAEVQRKQFREIENKYKKEKNDIVQTNLRQKHLVENNALKDIHNMREAQKEEFIKGRDFNKARFSTLDKNLNDKREKFEKERIQTVQKSNVKENKLRNNEFVAKFDKRSKEYEKDLRRIENRHKATLVADGGETKRILAEQRLNEKDQLRKQNQKVLDERADYTRENEKRVGDLTDSYQQSFKDIRFENSAEMAKERLAFGEEMRQKRLNDKITMDKIVNDGNTAVRFSEVRAEERLRSQEESSKTEIQNLKEDYSKGMSLAVEKSREDFEQNRAETVREKAILQKRLHEQNSKSNMLVRKTFHERMDKLKAGYEKRIDELENQNDLLQENSHESLLALRNDSMNEIERQRQIAIKSAKNEVQTERQLAQNRETKLRKTLNELQGNYAKRMNELSNENTRKMKSITRTMQKEKVSQTQKYEDIIGQTKKFYEREMAKLVSANQSERESLISQYENKISSLSKIHKDKLEEMQEFDKLNNNA